MWLTDSVDLVDEQGAPMDRTLLLEAVGSEDEAVAAGGEDGSATSRTRRGTASKRVGTPARPGTQ